MFSFLFVNCTFTRKKKLMKSDKDWMNSSSNYEDFNRRISLCELFIYEKTLNSHLVKRNVLFYFE